MLLHKIHIPEELIWDPQPDITPYELAQCLPLFVQLGREHHRYDILSDGAKRHWRSLG